MNPEISSDYEFKKYCSNVIDGKFYDDLTKGLNNIRNCDKSGDCEKEGLKDEDDKKAHRKFLSRRYISRLEVKKVYQIYLNGNNNRTSFVDGESVFINDYMKFKYPVIHEIITSLKNECEKEMKKKVVYTKLVDIETTFIFNVIKDLYERYDGLCILTVHDSICVPESFQERVQIVWDEHLEELIKELPYDASMNDEYEELSFASLGEEMFGEYLDNEEKEEKDDWDLDEDEDDDW